jgi:hypothetical protein
MEIREADRIDLGEVAEIEEGAAGIRVTWRNGERQFLDGGAAQRLLERWQRAKGAER